MAKHERHLLEEIEIFLLTVSRDDVPAPVAPTPEHAVIEVEKPLTIDELRLLDIVTALTLPRISVEQPVH
jgi:hypothetical protein